MSFGTKHLSGFSMPCSLFPLVEWQQRNAIRWETYRIGVDSLCRCTCSTKLRTPIDQCTREFLFIAWEFTIRARWYERPLQCAGVYRCFNPSGSMRSSRSVEQLLRSVGCAQNKGVGWVLLNTDSSNKDNHQSPKVLHKQSNGWWLL